ncbi:MAG: HPF/RaiA family ribosome-associated protein [Chitinophagaceae bacterium]|nr:MAG: HPF/RaiA family ribosome-associated protein [Chitinophagaceae bacterium]
MLIQINTDKNIDGTVELIAHFTQVLNDSLGRFDEEVTRLEVFLSDENASRNAGDDKKCVLEARLKGTNPVVITTIAGTLHQAVKTASDKMFLTLEKHLEKKRVQS